MLFRSVSALNELVGEKHRWSVGVGNIGLNGRGEGDVADIVIGGRNNELFDAGGGDDFLYGGSGADILMGGGGDDKIYEIALAPDWMSGTLVRTVTDPMLEAPATAAIYDDALYVVNARWDAEQTPDTEFWLIQLKR